MSYNKPIRRIAIVGTGVIGASWPLNISPAGSRSSPRILRQTPNHLCVN
jgi:hypothetical protein